MGPINQTTFQLPAYIFANGQVTGNQWSNPDNMLLVDGDYSSSNPNQTASDITLGYNFSFPVNAIITGFEMKVIGFSGSPTIPAITLKPYWLDNTTATDVYYPFTPVFTGFTPSPATYLLGGPTYTFASSISYVQANNFKLNLIANGNISLDSVLISFFYYIPVTPPPPPPVNPGCVDCNSPIQVQNLYLAQPFFANDRFMYLTSFNYPDGTPVNYADLGSCGGVLNFVIDPELSKLDPANNGNFAENTVTAIWTTMPSGQVQFDFGTNLLLTRGLQFHTPYAGVAGLRSDHNVGARVVISDNGPFLGQLLRQCQINTLVSAPIIVQNQGISLPGATHTENFFGGGVFTFNDPLDPHRKMINIPGFNPIPPLIVNTLSFCTDTPVASFSTPLFNVTGTDRFMGVDITLDAGITITSAQFNGDALTPIASSAIGSFVVYTLYLVAPALGTHTLDFTFSGLTKLAGNIVLYNSVNQATPVSAATTNSGNSALITVSPTTTTVNSIVFHAFGTAHFPILYTQGGGETIVSSTVECLLQSGVENQTVGTPATVTTQVSLSLVTDWADVAFGINGINTVVPGVDHFVAVDGLDTNPDYLDPKILLKSTDLSVNITKSIVDLGGGNEQLQYDLKVTGGGGTAQGQIQIDQTPDNGTYGLITGPVNGSNTIFTVSQNVYLSGKLQVYLNGIIQLQGASDDWHELSPSAGTFQFNTAPVGGDIITVVYQVTTPIPVPLNSRSYTLIKPKHFDITHLGLSISMGFQYGAYNDIEAYYGVSNGGGTTPTIVLEIPGQSTQERDVTIDAVGATQIYSINIANGFLYALVDFTISAPAIYRYDVYNLATGGTLMTVAPGATQVLGTGAMVMTTDGIGNFYFNQQGGNQPAIYNIISQYSLSGTTLTGVQDITCGADTASCWRMAVTSNGDIYGIKNPTVTTIEKFDNTGTLQLTNEYLNGNVGILNWDDVLYAIQQEGGFGAYFCDRLEFPNLDNFGGGNQVNVRATAAQDLVAGDPVGYSNSLSDEVARAVITSSFPSFGGPGISSHFYTTEIAPDKFACCYTEPSVGNVLVFVAQIDRSTMTATIGNFDTIGSSTSGVVAKLDTDKFMIFLFDPIGDRMYEVSYSVSGTTITRQSVTNLAAASGAPFSACQVATDKVVVTWNNGFTPTGCHVMCVQYTGFVPSAGATILPFGGSTANNGYVQAIDTDRFVVINNAPSGGTLQAQIGDTTGGNTITLLGATSIGSGLSTNGFQLSISSPSASLFMVRAYSSSRNVLLLGTESAGVITTQQQTTTEACEGWINTDGTFVYEFSHTGTTTTNVINKITITGGTSFAKDIISLGFETGSNLWTPNHFESRILYDISGGYYYIPSVDLVNGLEMHIQGMSNNFIGIAQENIPRGSLISVLTKGVDNNQSGLSAGNIYTVDKTGFVLTGDPTVRYQGVAQSATEIEI